MTDRDHFAAAALTGLLSRPQWMPDECVPEAYKLADDMLREREQAAQKVSKIDSVRAVSANHDAAPAARASVGRPRTDKADLPTRCGTGNTPVAEPLPVFVSGSGSGTPVSYAQTDEKRVLYDTKSPRNGALSGCETVPDPDSRVWETPYNPPPHATPPQGSVQGEGSFRDSRFAKEPVAWAVAGDYGEYAVKLCFDEASAVLEADRRSGGGLRPYYVVVPLYRHPQPTLTDAEREAVERAADLIDNKTCGDSSTIRGLLERLA